MPFAGVGWRHVIRPRCNQQKCWTWSYMSRGGCRFEPGHSGPCKPVSRGRRNYAFV